MVALGMLPVMEIVFLLKKVVLVENQHIIFYSVQGMPMSGDALSKFLSVI
jgi:hypothetical protein